MKKIFFLIILFAAMPLLGQSEESGVSVKTGDVEFEMKSGTPDEPPERVVVERTTTVHPKGGCGCSLDTGGPCK